MISRPYKVAYYINSNGKDCGILGEYCDIVKDVGALMGGPPKPAPPSTAKPNPKNVLGFSGSKAPTTNKLFATGSVGAGVGKATGSIASGSSGIDTKSPIDDLNDFVNKVNLEAEKYGLPPGLGVPLIVVTGLFLVIILGRHN